MCVCVCVCVRARCSVQAESGELARLVQEERKLSVFALLPEQKQKEAFLVVRRRPTFFINALIFPMFFIMLFTFSVYWIECGFLSDRLVLLVTILLTITAFKFVCSGLVPPTSNLSVFDMYVLSCYALVGAITVESLECSVRRFEGLDWSVGQTLGYVWMFSHAVALAVVPYLLRRRNKIDIDKYRLRHEEAIVSQITKK